MQGGHKNTIRVLVQASEVEQKSVFHGFMQQTETELAVIVWQICICMQHIWNTKSESNVGIFQLAPITFILPVQPMFESYNCHNVTSMTDKPKSNIRLKPNFKPSNKANTGWLLTKPGFSGQPIRRKHFWLWGTGPTETMVKLIFLQLLLLITPQAIGTVNLYNVCKW